MKINPVESLPNLTNTAPRQILLGTELDEKSSSEQFLLSRYDSVQTMEIERERLLQAIANRIRKFEDLEIILQQTVKEIRHFLECDRILIYRFEHDNSAVIIAESTIIAGDSLLGKKIPDPCFEIQHPECYECVCIHEIEDIYAAGLHPCQRDFLASMQVQANLVVPILLQHNNSWGLLIAQHCQEKRKWQQQEIDLCKQIALQICIAVQQAELQQQVKYLQEQLELQKQQHTNQLNQTQKFQELLRRLTEEIRDSLDANQVLQTAVKELAELLPLEGCYIELYNQCQTSATVTYEYSYSSPHYHGLTRKVLDFPKIYQSLLQKQILQSLEIQPGWNTQVKIVSQLACPIFDGQGTLGNIWLIKSTEEKFDQLEISLVQEVANECAIAIRQSQLQEKTKAQVKELEKRERHKNQFLKTLSQELRTPITSISLAAQTLESLLTPSIIENIEIVPQLLQILNNECGRESKLINDLLTLTYLKSEPEPPTLITIDLETWLTPIVESFRDVAHCQKQNLNLIIDAKLPPLETDITDLERIITALLNHACKYTPTGESITISANLNADTLELKVCHTGVEIPNHEIVQVFQPFYRFTNHAPWKSSDSGLELALVKAMVNRLNGSINIKSGDRQITFTIKFLLEPVF
ncbi:GAF domain-containing protein [Sphaerospermopsis aphanizomenoides BCCUSP55]|uniref:sensor histidine kinase n=1 Tax=Sphaerospermopsis aphanizomenoides TaxID=459663 RepID=UPI0019038FB2|nr:GAF domain-containing protein [Sphaerospermopsis aphanizomenoides]MBK1987291.1 GAF domain-containing protein [Sphaerospermopsis aphanizomenoides BCCUSP55]